MTSSNLRRSIRTTSLSGSENMSAGRAPHTTFFADHVARACTGCRVVSSVPDTASESSMSPASNDSGVSRKIGLRSSITCRSVSARPSTPVRSCTSGTCSEK